MILNILHKLFVLLISFSVITILVHYDIVTVIDVDTLYFFQTLSGVLIYDNIMWLSTELSGIFSCVVFSVGLTIPRKTRRIGLISLLSVLISTIVCGYISYLIDRDTPDIPFLGSAMVLEIENDTRILGNEGSYPSGHIARITVIVATLINQTPKKYMHFLWFLPFMSSLSRLYMLQHHPTDIIAGIVIGLLIELVMSYKLQKIIEKQSEHET